MCFLEKTLFTRYLLIFCTLLRDSSQKHPTSTAATPKHPITCLTLRPEPRFCPRRSRGSLHAKFRGPKAWLNELEENSSHVNSAGGRALRLQAARWGHISLLRAGKQEEVLL